MVRKFILLSLLVLFAVTQTAYAAENQSFSDRKANLAEFHAIRVGYGLGTVRIVLDLTRKVEFKESYVENPSRMIVDLQNTWLNPNVQRDIQLKSTVGKRIRIAQFDPSTVRIVIESMAETKLFFLAGGKSGQRLIIDLGSAEFKEEPELNKSDAERERELQAQRERELQAQRERELQAQQDREKEIQDERERELRQRELELERREQAQREKELKEQRERELQAQQKREKELEERERELERREQAQRDKELKEQHERELQAQQKREKELEERERELERREKAQREKELKEQLEREVNEQRERDRERLEQEKREKKERERLEKEQREREKKERKERERLEKEQRERDKKEGQNKDKDTDKDHESNQPLTELDEDFQSLMTLQGKIIVIDPGHGGNDAGAIGPTGVMEKNVTLKVALELRKLLEAEGAQVIMTRDTDKTVSAKGAKASDIEELGARCDVANRNNADIFISIHADSFTRPEARGTTGYYYGKSTTGRGQQLADCIRRNLVEQLGTPSRGTQPCNFYVVKNTDMPATLIELGFISNKEEEKLLDSEDGVKRAAQGIFDGIEDYFG